MKKLFFGLLNKHYIVRLLNNTNETQILHLKKFVPKQPLEDNYCEEKWEAVWGNYHSSSDAPNPTYLPTGEQLVTSNYEPNDAHENEVDYKTRKNGLN